MPSYKGLHSQIQSNNRRSILLLIGFPSVIIGAIWLTLFFLNDMHWDAPAEDAFIKVLPIALGAIALWFLIAFTFHSKMIQYAVNSKPLERKENMRVYNLVENLCMSVGMKMPKVYIMETEALNAFASGINDKTYAVTLTRGIINKLDDAELEGVIAHELAHIRNKDVRLLIVSIIFVGIVGFIMNVAFRSVLWGGGGNRRKQDGRLMLIILLVSALAYLLTIIFRFALSRKREYLADAGAAEMTKRPEALASALRKISGNSTVDDVKSDDVKSMFIENNPKEKKSAAVGISGIFATHPPIEKRISFLEKL
ncbi:MAG: M48 family metallopeptidase [Crocinitomicaceae bacterium]|nr:M48 family metallopeptidase [Crocinitomicaceae bacterium]